MSDLGLADLEAFAAVAERRSFRRAAKLRGVSASSLSEAVRRLEARLEVRLLNRTTRSVTPTEAGQRLLERLKPALGELMEALDAVNSFRDSPTGTLRLNVPTVVSRLVMPRIAAGFLKTHPGVRLEVVADNNFVDVLAEGFDAGVRYDESLALDMIAVPIGPRRQAFVLGAAPAYLAEHGTPEHPRDLLQHRAIRHRHLSGVLAGWEFERDGETLRIDPGAALVASDMELEIAAAIEGLGVVGSFDGWLRPHFESGALVPLLEEWWESFSGPFLYYPSRRHMPAPLRAFVDYVKAHPWEG